MIIDSPRPEQLPALRKLWREAFGDPDAYLELFFSTAFCFDRCRCVTEEGHTAAMLYWFDCTVEGLPFAYLFAVATAKNYQGRGLCRALMADTHRHLKKLGYAGAILVPAEESLFAFYGAMGYTPFGGVHRFTCTAAQQAASLQLVSPEDYHALRQNLLPLGGVVQDLLTIRFLAKQTALYAGEGFLLSCYQEENTLYVQEYLGDPAKAPAIVTALGCREGRFRTPGESPFAMCFPLLDDAPTPTYFGIALD